MHHTCIVQIQREDWRRRHHQELSARDISKCIPLQALALMPSQAHQQRQRLGDRSRNGRFTLLLIACIGRIKVASRNGAEFRSEAACLSRAEEAGVGKWIIVEAGSGPTLAGPGTRPGPAQWPPEAPLKPLYFTGTVPLQVSSRSANGACQCPGPLCRRKYRYSASTVLAENRAPSSACAHPFRHYQLAHCQYKYMRLAASAVAWLIDPLSLPLWTSVDSPATYCPSFFLFSHAPFVLVSSPFFFFSFAQLLSLIQTRRARIQLRLFPAEKQLRCISDLRPRPPEDLGNSSRLTSICIRCRQSKVIAEAQTQRRKSQRKRLPPATSTAFLFLERLSRTSFDVANSWR